MRTLSTGCLPVERYKLLCHILWLFMENEGACAFLWLSFSLSLHLIKTQKRTLLALTDELITDN